MHPLVEKLIFVSFCLLRIKGWLTVLWNVFIYFAAPVIVMKWPKTVGNLICMNLIGTPGKSASDPQAAGIENASTFEVQVQQKSIEKDNGEAKEEEQEAKIVRGWHICPSASRSRGFGDGQPIFIICNGSFGSLAESWRVDFFQKLGEQYHVMAFDYRGFGGSDQLNYVTEASMVDDVLAVYNYVEENAVKSSSVFLWGHGVGSGAVSTAASLLTQRGQKRMPTGVILSGSFFNLEDFIKKHKWFLWSGLPFYERLFLDAVQTSEFRFLNNQHILDIRAPVAILHADDDELAPFASAFRLYEESKRRKNGFFRQFYGLIGHRGIGHRGLATADDLHIVLDCFMDKCDSLSKSEVTEKNENENELKSRERAHSDELKGRSDFLFLETPNSPTREEDSGRLSIRGSRNAPSTRGSRNAPSIRGSRNAPSNPSSPTTTDDEGEVEGIHFYSEVEDVVNRKKDVDDDDDDDDGDNRDDADDDVANNDEVEFKIKSPLEETEI